MRILNRVEFVNTAPPLVWFAVLTPVSNEEADRHVINKVIAIDGQKYVMGDLKVKGRTRIDASEQNPGAFEYTSFLIQADPKVTLSPLYRSAYYTDDNPREAYLYALLTYGELQSLMDDFEASMESYRMFASLAGN